jgi:ABC-type multidrug transport system permease subunit
MGIVALTKNTTDREGSRRLTKIGWIVFAVTWAVGILLAIGFIVFFFAVLANSSSNTSFGN